MEEFVTAKDTVIVANREDAQIGALQTGVQCIVVCMGTEVSDKVLELAKEKLQNHHNTIRYIYSKPFNLPGYASILHYGNRYDCII